MDKQVLQFIDAVIKKLENNDISALEVEAEGVKVRAERNVNAQVSAQIQPQIVVPQIPVETASSESVKSVASEVEKGKVIKSPIVGTCYLSPSPDTPEFVQIGSKVSKGDTVLIVEAMKIMNEIESEFSGSVKQILVSNGELVEFGQPLMIID